MKRASALAALIALSACGQQSGAPTPDTKPKEETKDESKTIRQSACRADRFEDIPLTVCEADPARHRIRMDLGPGDGDNDGNDDGKPYRSLATFAANHALIASRMAFVVNGGMFDEQGQPVGYYVEGGKERKALNRNEGPGNFHLLPNGIFYGTGGKWAVQATDAFAAREGPAPDFATQSGPMLVIDGKLHPDITTDGMSTNIRNGVGVDKQGRAFFVMSDGPLSFGKLARYFRDKLETPNALYLDGKVSALWDPATGRLDSTAPLGPLIVVEQSGKGTP